MESIENLPIMVDSGVFMASIDLKDAFFSVPINEDHQKFLKFFLAKTTIILFACQMDIALHCTFLQKLQKHYSHT